MGLSFEYGPAIDKEAAMKLMTAEIIQNNTGADLVAVESDKPYPEDYQQTAAQVEKQNETGYKFVPKSGHSLFL